jgi:hypothetical protein
MTFMKTSTKGALIILWLVFVLRGLFYAAILPVWEGYDEPYHFASIQYVVANGKPPSLQTRISREVSASFHVLPLPWMLRLHGISPPVYTHDDFWKLTADQRAELQKSLHQIPRDWANEPSREALLNYEAQQPPLYYFLFSIPLRLAQDRSLESRVLILRLISIVVASFALPIGYLIVKRVTGQSTIALAIVGLATMMPELFIDISRVGNECLALFIYTGVIYLAVRVVEGPGQFHKVPFLGCLVGSGLLTKAYFVTALPAVLALALWCYWKWPRERRQLLSFSAIGLVSIFVIAGPWYWHVHHLTGSWSGLARESIVSSSPLGMMSQILHVNWISGIKSIVLSHIWFGAWSFLRVPEGWYAVFGIIFAFASLGLLVSLYRHFKRKDYGRLSVAPSTGRLVVLLSFCGFFGLGLGYDILLTYVSVGVSSSTGWYMYCLIVPELLLLYYGLQAVLPRRAHAWILPSLTTAFFLLDAYGIYFLLVPYYTGLIFHIGATGQVAPARAADLWHAGTAEIVQRLLINKPTGMTPGAFYVLWFLTVLGSAWVVIRVWARLRVPEAR